MRLGAQLYTFEKEYLLNNADYIFCSLAELDYTAIEMPFMMDIAVYMKKYNLYYSALHLLTDELYDLPKIMSHLQRHNCQHLCVSGPLNWQDRSLSNFAKSCEFLNSKAQALQAQGITMHYHNHDFEFIKEENGQKPMDILLQQLDPNLIKLCVDTGWLSLAGADPVSFLQEHKQRISYLHLRDFLQGNAVALGQGSIDIKRIMHELDNNYSLDCLLVEHNPTKNGLQQFSESRAYLRNEFSL